MTEQRMIVPIAVVLSGFEAGGTERQMTELIRRLDRRRFRVHVVCFRRRGPWLRRVETSAYEVVDFPLRSFKSPAAAKSLIAFARWLHRRPQEHPPESQNGRFLRDLAAILSPFALTRSRAPL